MRKQTFPRVGLGLQEGRKPAWALCTACSCHRKEPENPHPLPRTLNRNRSGSIYPLGRDSINLQPHRPRRLLASSLAKGPGMAPCGAPGSSEIRAVARCGCSWFTPQQEQTSPFPTKGESPLGFILRAPMQGLMVSGLLPSKPTGG